MSFEVDVLAVGEESKSGDAIALRFGNLNDPTQQSVVIIDGGFQASGEKLVQRIRQEYGTDYVDLVISTHPDQDHLSGLHVVLKELQIGKLWMHCPWHRNDEIRQMAEDRDLLKQLTATKFKKSLQMAYDLEKLAKERGIPIEEPFQGHSAFGGTISVLGPSEDFYHELASEFHKARSISPSIRIKRLVQEAWHRDELAEPEEKATSHRNNASVIVLALLGDDGQFMFCGDAGVEALHHAVDFADSQNYCIATNVTHHQVPHHGSKRNVGPSILDRMIGPIQAEGYRNHKYAFISAAPEGDPKHPSNRVINAFTRRGVGVLPATCGTDQCFKSKDVPMRAGWTAMSPVDFIKVYDEE